MGRRSAVIGFALCMLALGLGLLLRLGVGAPWGASNSVSAAPAQGTTHSSARGLSALPATAQGPLSAALGRSLDSYRVQRLTASNPTQRLHLRFSSTGVVVSAGRGQTKLGLGAFGRPGALTRTAPLTPRAAANRVSYARGSVRESYVNGPVGLEQLFDVVRRPGGAGPLELVVGSRAAGLRLEGQTRARLALAGGGTLQYSGLQAIDARGRVLRAWLAVERGRLSVFVDDRGAAYPLHIDPFVQQGSKLVGTGYVGTSPEQGWSVALSSDGNTALVGGPCDTPYSPSRFSGMANCVPSTSYGAAWVFVRSGVTWTQQAELVGTGETGQPQFGTSVALSNDGNTALIGGPQDNGGVGATWVFTRSGTTWSPGTKLVGTGATGTQEQGLSVALSGDGNTALIGGPQTTSANGAEWVFARSSGKWTQQQELPDGSGLTSDTSQQGFSVALSGDGTTALVGAPQDGSGAGSVRIFLRTGTTWTQQGPRLVGTGASGMANQGSSVALSADGSTALSGGLADNNFIGATWVFTRSGTSWSQQGPKLVGSGVSGAAAYQGTSVSLSGDGNTALIGGDQDNSGVGAAWVFARAGTTWSQQGSKLVGSGAVGPAGEGSGVALSSDGSTALIGGYGDNGSIGAAWPFTFVPPPATVYPVSASGGYTFSGTAPATISGTVATFATADPAAVAGNYSASIGWGDGTSSAGVISGSAPTFTVTGSHTYTTSGSYTITVTIVQNNNSANTQTLTDFAGIASTSPSEPALIPGTPAATSSTTASDSSSVIPNGLQTNAYYQYGLDERYLVAGGSGAQYDQSTNSVSAGSGYSTQTVVGSLTRLVPNALYHIRLVASNSAGTVYGPDQTFMTKQDPAPGNPVLAKSFNVQTTSGLVFVEYPGSGSSSLAAHATVRGSGFVPLTEARQLPMGARVDTRTGTVKLTTATGKKKGKKLQNATTNGAIFSVAQTRSGKNKGLVTLKVLEGAFPGAPSFSSCKAKKAEVGAPLARIAVSSSVLSTLHVRSHGSYSSRGRYGSATARATAWTISDRCNGTLDQRAEGRSRRARFRPQQNRHPPRRTALPGEASLASRHLALGPSPDAYAVTTSAACPRPSSSIAVSRILNFCTLPVTVIGNESTNLT